MLTEFYDMTPGITWGSMDKKVDQDKWNKNKCDIVVGGSSKRNCEGSFQNLGSKHFYCYMQINLRHIY